MPSVFSKPLAALNPSTRKLFAYLAGLAVIGSALRAAGASAARSKSALPAAAAEEAQLAMAEQSTKRSHGKPGVNMEFLKQLTKLVRICIPGVFTPEAFWATLATCTCDCYCLPQRQSTAMLCSLDGISDVRRLECDGSPGVYSIRLFSPKSVELARRCLRMQRGRWLSDFPMRSQRTLHKFSIRRSMLKAPSSCDHISNLTSICPASSAASSRWQ
mgnify:CR=1 FL=1